jgi:hypothetical protein
MKIALIVSLLVTSLALNAEMLQGKVVRVADGDMITIFDEVSAARFWLWKSQAQFSSCDFS